MENYKERYKDLLNTIKVLRDNNPSDEGIQNWVNDNVPELKESEDERIRKSILTGLIDCRDAPDLGWSDFGGVPIDDCIAWIEKQGEQKPVDKVEPKFKNGQWIVWQDKCYKVNYNGCGYEMVDQNGLSTSLEYGTVEESAHFWTIEDAKPGDVLQLGKVTAIFKEYIGGERCTCYCSFCKAGGFEIPIAKEDNVYGCYDDTTPATKEQRDLLFQNMKEAGYEWNTEKKDLKNIVSYCQEHCKGYQETGKCFADGECQAKREAEQKPAWGEEDENILKAITYTVKNSGYKQCIGVSNENMIDWLESLKDRVQHQWKPSYEQMQALHDLNLTGNVSYAGQGQKLIDLYNDLLKLKA